LVEISLESEKYFILNKAAI